MRRARSPVSTVAVWNVKVSVSGATANPAESQTSIVTEVNVNGAVAALPLVIGSQKVKLGVPRSCFRPRLRGHVLVLENPRQPVEILVVRDSRR